MNTTDTSLIKDTDDLHNYNLELQFQNINTELRGNYDLAGRYQSFQQNQWVHLLFLYDGANTISIITQV